MKLLENQVSCSIPLHWHHGKLLKDKVCAVAFCCKSDRLHEAVTKLEELVCEVAFCVALEVEFRDSFRDVFEMFRACS